MPKPSTFPTLYDEALQISISKLKQWGYLIENTNKGGTVSWSVTHWGEKQDRGNISIKVNMAVNSPYIELIYNYRNEPRKYKVLLVSIPSNLGTGKLWYFLCPSTNKRCRKLYSIGGYFLHRKAFNSCMYESQTKTKKWREMEKLYGCYFDCEKYYAEIHQKHFKKFYNGKPTKRYLRLTQKIQQAERISFKEIERLMIFGI